MEPASIGGKDPEGTDAILSTSTVVNGILGSQGRAGHVLGDGVTGVCCIDAKGCAGAGVGAVVCFVCVDGILAIASSKILNPTPEGIPLTRRIVCLIDRYRGTRRLGSWGESFSSICSWFNGSVCAFDQLYFFFVVVVVVVVPPFFSRHSNSFLPSTHTRRNIPFQHQRTYVHYLPPSINC